MRGLWVCMLCLAALLASAGDSRAEVYRWTDSTGRLHFSQDLGQVPARYRSAAEAAARAPRRRDPVQTYSAPAAPAPARRGPAALRAGGVGHDRRVFKIPVQVAGNSMRVWVRLNDRVVAPFIIDTGASDVVVPRSVVEELGIELAQARTGKYSTANGVIETKLILLDSVELGGARLEGVPAAVGEHMPIGLLGLSYFNRFNYKIDSARGLVTLEPNDMEAAGLIRGGRSEAEWLGEYAQLHGRERDVERRQQSTPSSRSRRHGRLEAELRELARQLEALDSEADAAHVPFSWRD